MNFLPKAMLLSVSFTALSTSLAAAQDTQSDTIVVTARRDSVISVFADTPERDLPVSIRTVDSADIQARMATDLNEILELDPSWTPGLGADNLNSGVTGGAIRGFDVTKYMTNGVPLGFSWNASAPETLERVEVLRGVAGFSYGYMPPGGSINVVTKMPTAVDLTDMATSVDSEGYGDVHADLSRRVAGEALGIRANFGYGEGRRYTGAESERAFIDIAAEYKPNPDTTIAAFAERLEDRTDGRSINGVPLFVDGSDQILPGLGPRNFPTPNFQYYHVENAFYGARLDHEFSADLSLTAFVQKATYHEEFLEVDFFSNVRPDGLVDLEGGNGWFDFDALNFATLLNYSTEWFGLSHRITQGLQYSRREGVFATQIATFATDYDVYNPAQLTNPLSELPAASSTSLDTESGAFLSDVVGINDKVRLLLGVRWSQIESENTDLATSETSRTPSQDAVTPLVGAMWDVTHAFSIYANYTLGIEPGGTAPIDASNAGERMPVAEATQYEAGFKWEASRNLRVDAAIFRLERPSEFYLGPGTEWRQDGLQVNDGAELLVNGRVNSVLSLNGGVQYIDATLEGSSESAAVGDRAPGVPKWQWTFGAVLDVPTVPGLSLNAVVAHFGEVEVDVPNSGRKFDAFTTLDLGAEYRFEAGGTPLTASLRIENATEEEYFQGFRYSAPRMATFSLAASF